MITLCVITRRMISRHWLQYERARSEEGLGPARGRCGTSRPVSQLGDQVDEVGRGGFDTDRLFGEGVDKAQGLGVQGLAGERERELGPGARPVDRVNDDPGVAFAQTGGITRSRRLWRRTFALVATVLPGSWVSLPIASRATTRPRILLDVKQTGGANPSRLRPPRR